LLSVEAFLRDLVGRETLAVEELMPTFEQLWLSPAGEPVCSEFRLTAFRRRTGAGPRGWLLHPLTGAFGQTHLGPPSEPDVHVPRLSRVRA
jgi:hypothetical protein